MVKEIDVCAITRKTYDRIAAGYSQKIKELTSKTWVGKFEKHLADRFLSLIREYYKDDLEILDIGCGYGKDTYYFSKKARVNAKGFDFSPGMLSEARKLYPDIYFVEGDMRDLGFLDIWFHGVWANGCIYHVRKKEVDRVLTEVVRVLRPGGIFSFNFKLGEGERLEKNPRSYGGKPRFYAYYNNSEMIGMLEQAGLDLIELRSYPETIFADKIMHVWARKSWRTEVGAWRSIITA